jgi:hypothetical protein
LIRGLLAGAGNKVRGPGSSPGLRRKKTKRGA